MLINTSTVINCAMHGMAGKQIKYRTDKYGLVLENKSRWTCNVEAPRFSKVYLQCVLHVSFKMALNFTFIHQNNLLNTALRGVYKLKKTQQQQK